MFDYTNLNPILLRGPEKTPLQLEVNETRYNPLPSGGLISDMIFGPVRSIDPTLKFSPDAWAVRQQEEDTWGEVADIEMSLSAASGGLDSFGNAPGTWIEWATGVKVPKLFNNPANGAVVKALYLNRSPREHIKWGDSDLSEEAVKEAQTTLGLLFDKEQEGVAVDPNNLTDNQKKMKEVMDYLIYAQARKRAYESGNYSFADYFAATSKDTPGLFGSYGGPWNWVTEKIGEYYGAVSETNPEDNTLSKQLFEQRSKSMPKDLQDLNEVFSKVDPYFNYEKFWEQATENPIVMEGLLDNGVSINTIRGARNADEANFLLNKALVNSHLQKRLAVYEANSNVIKNLFGGTINLGVGMVLDPSTAPLTLATVGTGLTARAGLTLVGRSLTAAAPALGIKLAPALVTTGRGVGMATEALFTLPLGGAPVYAHNLNVLARAGFTVAGGALVGGLQDLKLQNQQLAYAAAMQYSDPDSQIEFDSSRMFAAFGHGALAGSGLFFGGALLSSTLGALGNRVMGVKKTVELPILNKTIKIATRDALDRRLTFEGTTIGEIVDTFGTVKGKIGTIFERTPAEKVQIDALNNGTEPTAQQLNTETNDQVNRSQVRSNETADNVNNTPEQSLYKRLDNETRTQYAQRMGLSKALTNPREFLSELGRRTTADIDANDNIGVDGTDMTNLTPNTRARVLIDAEQRIKDAMEAEKQASGGTLAPDRVNFYNTLEKYRKSWLTNTLRKLTPVERKEFYKSIRGEPVEDRINTARNKAIDSATRDAAADSVAAQLLEAARSKEPTVEIKDPVVKDAVEKARLENKVLGSISNETSKFVVNIVKNKTQKTKPKIIKLIDNALKEISKDSGYVKRVKKIAKDNSAFIEEARGSKDAIKNYYNFVLELESQGLLTAEHKTIALLAALDYDFSSTTMEALSYKIVDQAEATSADGGVFAGQFNPITSEILINKDAVYTKEEAFLWQPLTIKVLLHELGHAAIQNIFKTESYKRMLESYTSSITNSPFVSNLWFSIDAVPGADPVFSHLQMYHISNAEEMLVQTYAEFSFALNREKIVNDLTILQKDFIRTTLNAAASTLAKIALGLDQSDYFNQIQPLLEEIQTMSSSIKGGSVKDTYGTLVSALISHNELTELNNRLEFLGAKKLTVQEYEFFGFTNKPSSSDNFTFNSYSQLELTALAMLKSEGKDLILSSGNLSKDFKTFYSYLKLLKDVKVTALTKQFANEVALLISNRSKEINIRYDFDTGKYANMGYAEFEATLSNPKKLTTSINVWVVETSNKRILKEYTGLDVQHAAEVALRDNVNAVEVNIIKKLNTEELIQEIVTQIEDINLTDVEYANVSGAYEIYGTGSKILRTSIHSIIDKFVPLKTNYELGTLIKGKGLSLDEFTAILDDSLENQSSTVLQEVTYIFRETGFRAIAEELDARFLIKDVENIFESFTYRPGKKGVAAKVDEQKTGVVIVSYNAPQLTPTTAKSLSLALRTVTEKNAKAVLSRIAEFIDPLTLAVIQKTGTEFDAIKSLETLAADGKLVYAPSIKKWTLRTEPIKEAVAQEAGPTKQQKPSLSVKEQRTPNESIPVTTENLERTLTSFYDPSSSDGKTIRALLRGTTKNTSDIDDAVTNVWIKFTTTALPTLKDAITNGRIKTVAELRKYFAGSVKKQILDEKKKGKSTAGLEALKKTVAKLETELQQAKEAGKNVSDLEDMLYAAKFDLETYSTKTTKDIFVEGTDGTLGERPGMSAISERRVTEPLSEKELQEVRGIWLYKIDQAIRSLLKVNDKKTVIFNEDQIKLWRYLAETGVEKPDTTVEAKKGGERVKKIRPQLSDQELAQRSEEIFGRELKDSAIQTIRSEVFKQFEDIKIRLRLTSEEIADSINPITQELDLNSKLVLQLKDELSKDIIPNKTQTTTIVPSAEELAKAAEAATNLATDIAAMNSEKKPINTIEVPQENTEPTNTVAFTVTDEAGNTVGTKLMTSDAADKTINNRSGEPVNKTAVTISTKDIVTVKSNGEVVAKDDAKVTPIGTVTVKEPSGVMKLENTGITIEKKTIPPVKETDPVVTNLADKDKPTPPPVKEKAVVQEKEHINFERLVNEHKDTLRANGSDVGFLKAFQKTYWKLMSKIDKAGRKTAVTPLFKELFGQYIAINRAIQEANIKLLGQEKVDAFWKAVDQFRMQDARDTVTSPGYKPLTEKQLLAKAAKSIHRQYQPPALLDGDLKIVIEDGKYVIKAKSGKTPKVTEPSPFPAEPKETAAKPTAPEVAPEATPAATTPAAAAPVAETPAKLPPKLESIKSSLYSAGNKMSMPLRQTNLIGWIFGGSNRAERNWWQKTMSNLANVIQHSSRLGDTARSNYIGIRVLTSLLDGTRNVTGMLVAPGQSPIMTLLGAKGVEDRVLVRIIGAQLDVLKKFGGDMKAIDRFNTYLWTKIAKNEPITEAGLVADLGMNQAAAKDILPSILRLADADYRTKELYLRLGLETGMAVVHDINGNPFDPKTWMNIQVDHEKLRAIMQNPDLESALINALVESRRKRKMGEELDINTLIVLGWLDARTEGGDPKGSLMLRDRAFGEGFGVRKLTKETLDKLEIKGAVLGGANPSTIASIAKHGMPRDYFVLDVNGELRAYRVPRKRSDLSQADLLIYDQAVRGDTSMYLPKWQTALGNQELTRLEMIELLEHKMKRGRYMELKSSDRPLLKIQQREDVQLAVPALIPDEILNDSTGAILGMIRTNLGEAHMYFLRGRLTEMLFHKELHKLFGRSDISIDEVFDVVKEIENKNILDISKKEKWNPSQEEAALLSLERGLKRLKEEYRYNVETLPIVEQTTAGSFAEGTLTLARIFTAPGYWLSAGPEVMGALLHHYPTEWPKAFGESLKFTLGKYRASKSQFLASAIGDCSFALQMIRTDLTNRYLGEQGRGAFTVDSTFDTVWNGPRSQWNNKPMQMAERAATLSEQVGSLAQISNIPRYLSKIEMQRTIYRNIKDGKIQGLIEALKDPETNRILLEYLKASSESAFEERKLWKKFAGVARKNKFGRDPNEALFYMRYGLNTLERIEHLKWAIEKVGDSEGRVNFIRLMELAEDVRRKPVEGINVGVLEDAINAYAHGIEAEILKRRTPEPYGLLKATDLESRSAIGKVVLALSGWMRAFHDSRLLDYSNKSTAGYLKFAAAYAAIDSFTQVLKEWLAGRDVSDILEEATDNPISIMTRAIHSLPFFGMFNGFFETAMNKFNSGSLFNPTMELSTPGIAVANSVVSRTDKGMSQAYKAMSSGDLPEAAGYLSNVLPVASYINKSPLAVPVKVLESAVELDERNLAARYMEVVRKDSQPYAQKRNKRSKNSSKAVMPPAPQRNVAKEEEELARLRKMRDAAVSDLQPMAKPPMGLTDGVSTPLADLLE